jgi:hypothetical protein
MKIGERFGVKADASSRSLIGRAVACRLSCGSVSPNTGR